ncbi:MAG TPA: hypothetical protein K8V84_21185 [Nocardiopsis listeri]|uniref:hypothetical protein n=1 Tax=Nocardiopsis listeri TaxID=53440 RepID=UPI001D63DD24|nr:hypothetical protein [Nocardiopsis listeri]HJE60995.1 hypothetical protein [Nocardiopsis listeri]
MSLSIDGTHLPERHRTEEQHVRRRHRCTGRDTAKPADLAESGVSTARADFEDPASPRAAFAGAHTLLLVSGVLGREVAYRDLGDEEFRAVLGGTGMDEDTVEFVAGLEVATREGGLYDEPGLLSELIGRPTTPIVDTLRAGA